VYLLREFNVIYLLIVLFLWGVAGWLICARIFNLDGRERGLVSFGVGLIVNNWIANLCAQFIPMPYALWVATLLTLGLGIALAWPLNKELREKFSPNWGQWIVLAALTLLFTLIGRGQALYDDYQNLPGVSLIAAGEVPPHFPVDPDLHWGYHYFVLLLGAQIMLLAKAAPWTALDLARAVILALSLMLGGTWAWRLTKSRMAEFAAGIFLAFVTNARWILFLVPRSILDKMSAGIPFWGTAAVESGGSLPQLLVLSRHLAGSGPILFPYAFASDVEVPFTLQHGGRGNIAVLLPLLLLLVVERRQKWPAYAIVAILLASLALGNEVTFTLLYIGLAFAAIAWLIVNRRKLGAVRTKWPEALTFVIAGVLTIVQGGIYTEVVRGWLNPASTSVYQVKFSIVAPAIVSSHLGSISLLKPLNWIIAFAETGPVILVLPLLIGWGLKAVKEGRWMDAGMAGSAVAGLLTLFLRYSGNVPETATTRMFTHAISMCKIYALPLVWLWVAKRSELMKKGALLLGLVSMFAGITLFAIQLAAVPWPVYSHFLDSLDARVYQDYWNRLEPDALIFDPILYRSPVIFGRYTDAGPNWSGEYPEWQDLAEEPDLYKMHAAGFDYIYYDLKYYNDHKAYLDASCALIVQEYDDYGSTTSLLTDFRRLVNISDCK